jgi:hypothetical protein
MVLLLIGRFFDLEDGNSWGISCFAMTIPHFVPQLWLSCPRTAVDALRLVYAESREILRS